MRLSSRRLKVTCGTGADAVRTRAPPPWDWLGSISPGPNVMRRLLLVGRNDRADRGARQVLPRRAKGVKNARKGRADDHELVKRSHNNAQIRSIARHAALR